jgi:hypothetical protein
VIYSAYLMMSSVIRSNGVGCSHEGKLHASTDVLIGVKEVYKSFSINMRLCHNG